MLELTFNGAEYDEKSVDEKRRKNLPVVSLSSPPANYEFRI